jgi:alpha-galactosidase
MNDKVLYIYKDVVGKTITAGTPVVAYDLVIKRGSYDEVFDAYFQDLKLPPCRIDHMSGYTSWYNYYRNINKEIMLRDLDGLDVCKDEVSIFQIDDGYQITTGDWETNEKFPEGLRPIVDKIHEKGYKAGLWIAPFNASKKSSIYKNHKDWLIQKDGKPLFSVFNVDGGWYTMDIYNEEAREYIKSIFKRTFEEWDFDMVKLDFLYSQAMFPRNNKTRSEIMYEAIEFLRECVGDKLILGCGVPLAPCFGVVDACRIGCDVSPNYKGGLINNTKFSQEIVNAQNAVTNSMFRRHLNGKAFVNDPDVFFLRDVNIKYTEQQKRLVGFINNLFGDVLFVSDNVGEFSPEKVELLKKFFKKNPHKVYSVDKKNDEGDYEVIFGNNSTKHTLRFNLVTGESNVDDFLGE